MAKLWAGLMALICGVLSTQCYAQNATQSWDELVAAAKREGTVVVIGPAHPEVRQVLPAAFKARFGVNLEYLGGPAGIVAGRLRSERSAGVYTVDVTIAAIQTLATVFYQEKMLQPIKPLLILPEVLDGSKWKKGELWFPDPEHQYALRLFNSVTRVFSVNTGFVTSDDMRTAHDLLLSPKFKGKIAAHDPTVTGTGSNIAAQFYVQFGEDFVKQLYVGQQVAISRDERQLTDWLLRGTYPIVFGAHDTEVDKMAKEGLPLKAIYGLPGMPAPVSSGNGTLAVFDHAPHPNAAKLLVNWMASKEGLEVYARAVKWSPTRNDIDEKSFVPAASIPKPGVDYFDLSDWEFTVTGKERARLRMKELLAR